MQTCQLSVCYMVKNEAANLPLSLTSIKDAADEIIVVDTGSTDDTKAIAASFKAKVFDFPWGNNFSAPRNYAIEQASGEWILFLDGDEYFPNPLNREKLWTYLCTLPDKDAVLLLRRNIESSGNMGSWNTDWCLRLFRNRPDLRYHGRIHENIARQNGQLQVAYAPEGFCLLHTGYAGVLGKEKSQRNLELIEAAIAEDGWQPGYDYYLLDCYFGLHQYEKALQHAKSFLSGDCFVYGGDSHVYHMILECMRALKLPDEDMLSWAEEACQKHPSLPEFYAERGMILCGLGRLVEARQQLIEALLHYEQHTADKWQESYFSPQVAAKTAARLGEIAMHYDDVDEAAIWFNQAMEYCDTDTKVIAKVKKFLKWAKDKGIMP